jgi:hypothetical protein
MTTYRRVATAVVRDHQTGREIELSHRDRQGGEKIFAVVATADGVAREVRAGESIASGDAVYRIEDIQLSPPAIEVARTSARRNEPDRRKLGPRVTTAAASMTESTP